MSIPAVKERLFVYLSRFCEVRYCILRHCAFLLGYGHASGDPSAGPQAVEHALRLLKALDAETGAIVAHALTEKGADDAGQATRQRYGRRAARRSGPGCRGRGAAAGRGDDAERDAQGAGPAVCPGPVTVSAIEDLVTELARLPGIGRKTAQRLTFHLLQQPAAQVGRLARASTRSPSGSGRATSVAT